MQSTSYCRRILIIPEFFRHIFENKMSKIRPVGAELLHADWWVEEWTAMTKVVVSFGNFT
jgi:hypothetical protein